MKNALLLIAALILFKTDVLAEGLATNTTSRSCLFLHPTDGAYLETYLVAGANALTLSELEEGGFSGGVEVSIIILDATQTVVNFDKYILNTPAVKDSSKMNFSIMDQRRFFVPNKTLSVEVTVTDLFDPTNVFSSTDVISPLETDRVQISDIQFIENFQATTENNAFVKNGIEMTPYPINFFPSSQSSIKFYGEIYQTDTKMGGEPFMVTFSIRDYQTNDINQTFYQYIKAEAQPVYSFLREMPVADLPGGNYNLVIEVRNKMNEIVTQKKVFIQRANKGPVNGWENISMISTEGTFTEDYTEEQLNYFLDVIRPRASQSDLAIIESLSPRVEIDMKRKFLYNFWVERAPDDPYAAWKSYLQLVKEANDEFSTPSRQGYKTDRGRVYLQYGRPWDMVTSVNEPGAYPYEIWFYTTLADKQSNIGFAFYEPSGVSNDYQLLHSNARGELHDPRWKIRIYETVASPQEVLNLDNTSVTDNLGGHRAIDAYDF
jgi:GWxTD domain-containing protein